MSDRAAVRVQSLTFGTTGTSTAVASSATNTSNPIPLPRDDYTVQVTVETTGTSIGSGQVVWQTTNDMNSWLPQGTAAGTSTNAAGAGTASYASAAVAITAKYAYGRGIVSGTGTSIVSARVGS